MELNKQIKKYRMIMKMSQEELAEKIYVTRQTISNWENEKNYPDIHSILIMSSLFDVSLEELIKGDLDIMKEEIKTKDIKKFHHYSYIFAILLMASMVSGIPLLYFFDLYGALILALLFAITIAFAIKVEKYKKEYNIQTYKEIVAFCNGERLDEINQNREYGKRPYQQFLLALGCGLITAAISIILIKLLFIN